MRVASGRCASGAGIFFMAHGCIRLLRLRRGHFFMPKLRAPFAGKVQAILIRAARHRPHKTSQPPHQGHIRWSGNESLPPCRARQKTGNRKQVAPSLRDSGHLRNRFPALERGANVRCASGAGISHGPMDVNAGCIRSRRPRRGHFSWSHEIARVGMSHGSTVPPGLASFLGCVPRAEARG
jgi:hypothetical protein